ncbi:hypothetical protein K469DRAFT_664684 [Zopfia rhizophila CBS 207.26]|uniref:Uncharacterized protein n=1 Tax=Zopfia rhizophila CBS 207.26 TaxID=1314779 RepID=A0A6A6E1Q4_9PEZI|nr:hypothetical protein K469DRAFT_664684 [Zopfia rhizophila CBS 207.26]
MTAPSPSEFLTFYRRITTHPSLRQSVLSGRSISSIHPVEQPYSRQFCLSAQYRKQNLSTDDSVKTDKYPDDEHATKKKDDLDPQSANTKAGINAKKNDTGGSATEQRDSAGGKAKAKKSHPEAPDVAIGMQDERGGWGH